MDDNAKEILLEFKSQLYDLIKNTKHENGFDMLVWAHGLGQSSCELMHLRDIIGGYINFDEEDSAVEFYQITKKDIDHIYHRLNFIAINMVP